MKKALMMLALVGLVAGPAMASMAPLNPTVLPNSMTSVVEIGGSPSNPQPRPGPFSYKPNDPVHAYDNQWGNFGILGPAAYVAGASPYIGSATFVFDDVTLAPGYTAVSDVQFLFYQYGGRIDSCQNMTIAFFSNPGGLDTSIGATIAAYAYTNVSCGFFIFSAAFAQTALPQYFWIAFRLTGSPLSPQGTQILGSLSHTDGQAADGGSTNPTALHRGSGDSVQAFFNGASFSVVSAGQLMFAMNGKVPEPATIGLLAVAGVLALRRRKA